MFKSKTMKMNHTAAISPNMMLLHIRWQQIRLELLQQAAQQSNLAEGSQNNHGQVHKKDYIAA